MGNLIIFAVEWILLIIVLILSLIVIFKVIYPKFDGILYIDTSGEKDRYRFMVDDLDKMSKKKKLIIKVKETHLD